MWSASPASAPPIASREAFLHEADEIEVVDAPAGRPGRPYRRQRNDPIRAAWPNCASWRCCWPPTWWIAQLQEYLDAHGVAARWGAQERILVCLTPRSNAADMLRSGQRNALRFHGALLAAYVEQPDLPAARSRAAGSAPRRWRAKWAPKCTACKAAISSMPSWHFAREQRITQLFLGHTGRPGRAWLARRPIDRLIDGAEGFDVRLFPHGSAS